MSEVVITGLGAVAPHGDDAAAVFEALMAGQSAVRPVFPELARPAAAATVQVDTGRWFNKLQSVGVDRVSQLAVGAAELALADAGSLDGLPNERIGVYAGCGMGGAVALESAYVGGMGRGGRVPPLTIPSFMANAPAAQVAMRRQIKGPVLTYAVACASSAIALIEAAKALLCGEVDLAVAGGAEALLMPGVVSAWQAMQTLASCAPGEAARCCQPFAAQRSGFALGEGAAFLVLERAAQAQARGRQPYARLTGWGISCDATHLTKPDAEGQARALRAALRRADLQPSDVGYCNAHGTATRIGDEVEAQALRAVWGARSADLQVSSTKALHGHLLGGAGALEALVTTLALQQQRLPPNAHTDACDPALDLNLVLQPQQRAPSLQAAISSSFAFGGTNAVLLLQRSA